MQPLNTTVMSWGDALITSLTAAMAMFFAAIPRLLGFILILIIGWFVAGLVAKLVAGILRSVNFDSLAARSGFSSFVANMGVNTDASGIIALISKWFIRLIVLVVAFDALGLPAVSDVLRQFLLWLPNLVVGVVVLVIGGLAANAMASIVRGSTAQAGLGNPDFLASITRIAVWAFAIVVAVNQIGVATTLVNTLFMGLVGALALAAGLAFGLGGRETAAKIVNDWYVRIQSAKPDIERAATVTSDVAAQSPARR